MDMDMDNETGAQVHEAQSHSSAVEQSEDGASDVAMAGVNSVVEVPTTNIVGVSAEPFRFGTMARGLFNWRKRSPSRELDETHNKVILREVDKSIDLRMQLGVSENRRQKGVEKLATRERENRELQASNQRNIELLRLLVDEATKKVDAQAAELAHCKQQMEEERERHQREQAAKEKEMEMDREAHRRKQAEKEGEMATMVARLKQVKKVQASTPQAITRDETTTAGPSNHGPEVPDHMRTIPMSVDIPPIAPTVPASHEGTQPVPTSADAEQQRQNAAASEPPTSTPQAITRDETTTAGPSNHGPEVPDHMRTISMSIDIPPNPPTVPASHEGTQPVPTSADAEQQRQNAAASEPPTSTRQAITRDETTTAGPSNHGPEVSEPPTDILDTIRNIRQKHRRTNINTVLVIDEDPKVTETGEDATSSILQQNLGNLTERQKTLAHDMEALLPGVAQAVTKFMSSSTTKKYKSGKALMKEKAKQERATEDHNERLAYLRAIKIFLRNILKHEQNEDFVAHRPVTQAELEEFFANEGQGPCLEDLHFDVIGGLASDWNKRAFYLLTEQFCKELDDKKDLPARSKAYVNKMISDQFTRLTTIWRTGQRKLFDDDTWETNEELEARWTMRRDAQTHASRHAVRRFSKLRRRLHIIEFKIRAAEDKQSDDLMLWKWLRDLITMLGSDGMSSEESDVDRTLNVKVLRVNVQEWRRLGIDKYVELIDAERQIDEGGYKPAGAKPIPRIRASDQNKKSNRKPAAGLPAALYDETWLAGLNDYDRECILQVPPKPFKWLNFHSENREQSSIHS